METFQVSSMAWAMNRTVNSGPAAADWLEGFEEFQDAAAEKFAEVTAVAANDPEKGKMESLSEKGFRVGKVITESDVEWIVRHLRHLLPWPVAAGREEVRVRLQPVKPIKRYGTDDSDFLNSFIAPDIAKVLQASDSDELGSAVSSYLDNSASSEETRIDVRKEEGLRLERLSPVHTPISRWPSPGDYSLTLSPQFAVNSIFAHLSDGKGIFSVNGPPGTGKTTLLRDIVAEVITARASQLAAFNEPRNAFRGSENWSAGGYTRRVNLLDSRLAGFELVVASSNNKAVENVTREIPAITATGDDPTITTRYFADIATNLIGEDAWGLVAARLGNKANRFEFLSRAWYGKDGHLAQPDDDEGQEDEVGVDDNVSRFKGLRDELIAASENPPPSWRAVREEFLNAKKAVDGIVAERQMWQEKLDALRELDHRLCQTDVAISQITNEREALLDGKCGRWLHRIIDSKAGIRRLLMLIWVTLISVGQAIPAYAKLQRIGVEKAGLESTRAKLRIERAPIFDALSAQESLGDFSMPFGKVMKLDAEQREVLSLWMDKRWNHARARLFAKALGLHEAFIRNCAAELRQNLDAAADVLMGSEPVTAPERAVHDAWRTLFLVVPVLSTTFASFGRLFSRLGRESLGWVLIDEAGQATPQSAVGALWRARRSVIVGDPLQLEPVVTIPAGMLKRVADYFNISDDWSPSCQSCQTLADRQNSLGTWISTASDPVWVGAPLLVHRRCEEPMFTISNRIAYDNMMVYATADRTDAVPLPRSTWIDVASAETSGNWVEDEWPVAQALLNKLKSLEVPQSDIYIVSPFRAVADELRQRLNETSIAAGTVHTVQGAEAPVVILVLGGRTNGTGALQWAASRPNLLNVAISRAQRRIYVIGDHGRWRRLPFFTTLAQHLPKKTA